MHASEMADGNKWQKEIAKLAIDRLNSIDMVGVLYYDGSVNWHIRFEQVGDDKGRLKAKIDKMVPGDMMDFDSFLRAAYDTLSNPEHGLAVKHTIVISDGDPQLNAGGRAALAKMKADNISCTTIGVATHGVNEDAKMQEMADLAAIPRGERRGVFHKVTNPENLPAIYMRESRRVSQSFLFEKQFNPKLILRSGATDKLDDPLPDLYGFVRTTLKASPLAEMHIEGPRTFDQRFPILATWQYGLGRSAAFTSDARAAPGPKGSWDRDWVASEIYLKFWEQVVGWAMRGLETDRLVLTTEYREGKVRVVVDARDENNRPITDLKLEGKVSSPRGLQDGGVPIELKFEQRAGGYYEAEFKAEEAGSYIVNAQARQRATAYKGRFQSGLPMTTTERDGRLELADGTQVRRGPDGKLLYADDGTPVVVEPEVERVVDSRRAGVSISYSPEFADLETNATLLKNLARITGGEVYSEDEKALKKLAESGELYRPAPEGARALLPLWYWLVFLVGVGLLVDVGVRRISLEPGEVRTAAARTWNRLRKRQQARAAAEEDAFLARLKQKKAVVEENLEREKAARKFEATGPVTEPPPPGADTGAPAPPPVFTPKPPAPPPAEKPAEEADDYFSKLRKAKKRAPHEQDKGDDPAG
jgi:von Willebrand factor type A domain